MGPFALLNHLLNFVAPALAVAALVTLVARFFMKKVPVAPVLSKQFAINFIVASVLLAVGLLFFGRDGKMVTYAGMAMACATSQWLMLRCWRS
jgi:hypothetical protein